MRDNIKLSQTQLQFKEYILNEIKKDSRVIAFSTDGHFGADYTLNNISKKIKMISFADAISQDIVPTVKRVVGLGAAAGGAAATIAGGIAIQAALNAAVTYAIPNKDRKGTSFKYFFGYSPCNRKYRGVKKIIYLDDFDKLTEEEIAKFILIKKLIENKKLPRTVLVVSAYIDKSRRLNRILEVEDIQHFSLTKEDVQFFLKQQTNENLEFKDEDLSLIKSLGLPFLFNYYQDLLDFATQKDISNNLRKTKFFIQRILDEANIDATTKDNINALLYFVSVFHNYFSRLQVANYSNNALQCTYLRNAANLSIIRNIEDELYTFNYKIFREFYFDEYKSILTPTPEDIFNYISKTFPMEYITLLRVIAVDPSICHAETRLALLIKSYFFACKFGCANDRMYVLDDTYCKNHQYLYKGLLCYDNFILGKTVEKEDLVNFTQFVIRTIHDPMAACMAYILILQVAKECVKTWDKFDDTLSLLKQNIIKCTSANNEDIYFNTYFKELYIALAIESDNTEKRTLSLFKKEIEEIGCNLDINDFIASNKIIKQLNRLNLVAGSIESPKVAEYKLLKLAKDTTDIFTLQMAYNNLCVLFCETKQWAKASLYMKKINRYIMSAINSDTYLSYWNNDLLIKYFTKKISVQNYVKQLEKKIFSSSDFADLDIVKNNYLAAKLHLQCDINDTIKELKLIIANGNKFSQFYARNNLLYALYLIDDEDGYKKVKNDLFRNFPVILRECRAFFDYKFEYVLQNWKNKTIKEVPILDKHKEYAREMYASLVMFGGIERWFE